MAQKEAEEQREKERKKREYEDLMAMRTERDKNKIRKHLKVTKSANKSVLDDAVNKTDTAVTMQGPEKSRFLLHENMSIFWLYLILKQFDSPI